ncbi:DNA-dependent helicase II [compost metagenome]
MSALSGQQDDVVQADLKSLAVLACAGSGKTRTAIHRLLEVHRRLERPRGRVALLSFSNVAVDTFRRDYAALCQVKTISALGRVDIDTIDAFIQYSAPARLPGDAGVARGLPSQRLRALLEGLHAASEG